MTWKGKPKKPPKKKTQSQFQSTNPDYRSPWLPKSAGRPVDNGPWDETLAERFGKQPIEIYEEGWEVDKESLEQACHGKILLIAERALRKVEFICRTLDSSEGFWLYVANEDMPELIVDVIIPTQTVSAAYCRADPRGLRRARRAANKRSQIIVGAGHSHGSMRVFSSGTDVRELAELGGQGIWFGDYEDQDEQKKYKFSLFSTGNRRGDHYFPISKTTRCTACTHQRYEVVDVVDVTVKVVRTGELTDDEKEQLQTDIDEKVERYVYQTYQNNPYGGNYGKPYGNPNGNHGYDPYHDYDPYGQAEPILPSQVELQQGGLSAQRVNYRLMRGPLYIEIPPSVIEECIAKVPAMKDLFDTGASTD